MQRIANILIIFKLLDLILAQTISSYERIPHCIEYVMAPNIQNQLYRDEMICVECKLGYVVSKTYKQCIEFRYQLSYIQFGNCKRIAFDGQCAEAIRGIELLPNNQFFYSKESKYADRCAVVSENYERCLYPRLGYKLDNKTNEIFQDVEQSFCALFDSNTNECFQFQGRFVRIKNTQMGAYLGVSFLNPHMVSSNSTAYDWSCEYGYSDIIDPNIGNYFHLFIDQNVGCVKDKNTYAAGPSIKNCFHSSITNKMMELCLECIFGYSLNENLDKCEIVIPNCEVFSQIQKQFVCIQCFKCYKLFSNKCIYMVGCSVVSKVNPNQIIACNPYYRLQNGQCILQQQLMNGQRNNLSSTKKLNLKGERETDLNQGDDSNDLNMYESIAQDECEAYGENNSCYRCKESHNKVFDQQLNQCVYREASINCSTKSVNQDICIGMKCYQNKIFNFKIMKQLDMKNTETFLYVQYVSNKIEQLFDDQQMNQSDLDNLYKEYLQIEHMGQEDICIDYEYQYKNCRYQNQLTNYCFYCPIFVEIVDNPEIDYFMTKCQNQIDYTQQPHINNCALHDHNNKVCIVCNEGFYYQSNKRQCLNKLEHCFIHTKEETCYKCDFGFILNETKNQCEPICQTIDYNNGSSKYYYSLFYSTTLQTSECRNIDTPCSKFINNTCVECFQGFVLDKQMNNSCLSDVHFPDCKVIGQQMIDDDRSEFDHYSFEGKKCITCNQGYRLYAGRCYCQLEKCLRNYKCTSNNCVKQWSSLFQNHLNIENNSYLQKEGDTYIVLLCKIENCSVCDEGNQCLLCYFGYTFIQEEQKCVRKQEQRLLEEENLSPVADGCLEFQQNKDYCKKCKGSLYLMPDGKCYLECPINYQQGNYLLQENYCFKCPDGCKFCGFDPSIQIIEKQLICSECMDSFYYYPEDRSCKGVCIYYKNKMISLSISCVKSCDQYYQNERECVKSCPLYYIIQGTNKVCQDKCENPLFAYEDSKLCSQYCQQGYAPVDHICKKCSIKDCISCSSDQLDFCFKCKEPQVLSKGQCKFKCKNEVIVDEKSECDDNNIETPFCSKLSLDHRCVQCLPTFSLTTNNTSQCICSIGSFLNNEENKCEECGQGCEKCDKELSCTQCALPYIYMSFVSLGKELTRCVTSCPNGYYPKKIEQKYITSVSQSFQFKCEMCPQVGCLRCKDSFECLECEPQYELIKNGLQESTTPQTGIGETTEASVKTTCLCRESYKNDKEVCKYQCKNTNIIVNNLSDCCLVSNCQECQSNYSICRKCKEETPFLFLNTCLEECPKGTYADESTKACLKCHILCHSCQNSANNCLSCTLSQQNASLKQNCRCSNGMYFFQDSCHKRCPQFTSDFNGDGVCLQYCNEQFQFPIFDENGAFERCEDNFTLPSSKYCQQNLNNLYNQITFSVDDYSPQSRAPQKIIILISISFTPRVCYLYKLRGKFQNTTLPITLKLKDEIYYDIFTSNFRLEGEILQQTLKDNRIRDCELSTCSLYFDIYLKNILLQSYKLKLNFASRVILFEGVQDNSIILKSKQSIIDVSKIPKEEIVSSSYQLQCNEDSDCDFESILTQPNEQVSIEININQPFGAALTNYKTLLPYSISVQVDNSTNIPVNEFYFDNQFPSSIRLAMYFDQTLQGKLIIIAKVFNTDVLYQVKPLTIQKDFQYSISTVNVIVNKQLLQDRRSSKLENSDKSNSQTDYSFLTFFNTTVSVFLILYFFCRLCKQMRKCDVPDEHIQQLDEPQDDENNEKEESKEDYSYDESQLNFQEPSQQQYQEQQYYQQQQLQSKTITIEMA